MISTVDGVCTNCGQKWPCDCRPCPEVWDEPYVIALECDIMIRAGEETHPGPHHAEYEWANVPRRLIDESRQPNISPGYALYLANAMRRTWEAL